MLIKYFANINADDSVGRVPLVVATMKKMVHITYVRLKTFIQSRSVRRCLAKYELDRYFTLLFLRRPPRRLTSYF